MTIREVRFFTRLQASIKNFNLLEAEKLSNEMIEAELAGYEISKIEDRLHELLTSKIISSLPFSRE